MSITDECIHNVLYTLNGILSGLKKEGNSGTGYKMHEPWSYSAQWSKPGTEGQYCIIPSIWATSNRQIHRDRNLNRGYQGLEGNEKVEFFFFYNGELSFHRYRVSVWDDEQVEMNSGDSYATLWMYVRPQNHKFNNLKTVKMVNFVMYILPQ